MPAEESNNTQASSKVREGSKIRALQAMKDI
jgi:hypothetical protein